MACKCGKLEERIKELEKTVAILDKWVDEFEEGAEQAMKELEEQFGDVEVTFIPDPGLFRDKSKDN